MSTKKPTPAKKAPAKKASSHKKAAKTTVKPQSVLARLQAGTLQLASGVRRRSRAFLSRRPHRSFRATRRRDYARSLRLPGYWAFTAQVHKMLWGNRRIFLSLALLYIIVTALTVGIASQETYTELTNTLRDVSSEVVDGDIGQVTEAGMIFLTAATGGLTRSLDAAQQIYVWVVGLLTWLTTVWLLRAIMSGGKKVRLRDGLYSGGAPIVAMTVVVFVIVLQLAPLALALLGYTAAVATGLLAGGVEAMLFWVAFGLLATLSLYWITSSLVALVIVTLPGMYPFRALQIAGDMVVGRRLRILLRILWLAFVVVAVWALVLIPVIMFDTWLKGVWPEITWLPIIPVALLVLTTGAVVWSGAYIYMLYRKIVDDDAAPA